MKKQFLKTLQEHIPAHIKPTDYLMDSLDISRESAYRRIKGKIPFSVAETMQLASELDFSLDETLLGKNNNNIFYITEPERNADTSGMFFMLLKNYYDSFFGKDMEKSQDVEVVVSQNRLAMSMLVRNDILFKFYYYKYLHHSNSVDPDFPFSDVFLPEKIRDLHSKLVGHKPHIWEYTYVFSRNLFENICNEIQYFYYRKLMTDQDILLLKESLEDCISYMKRLCMATSEELGGIRLNMYVTLMDVSANTTYVRRNDDTLMSHFWVFPFNFIETVNSELCTLHKDYLDVIKKYSVLISQSNELFREKFFQQQQQYINSISDEFSFF